MQERRNSIGNALELRLFLHYPIKVFTVFNTPLCGGILWQSSFNTMVADSLALCVNGSLAVMILTTKDNWALVCCKEVFESHMPCWYQWIIKKYIYSHFLKRIIQFKHRTWYKMISVLFHFYPAKSYMCSIQKEIYPGSKCFLGTPWLLWLVRGESYCQWWWHAVYRNYIQMCSFVTD